MQTALTVMIRTWAVVFTLVLLAGCSPTAEPVSALSGSTGVIDGVTVYLGVVPAAMVRAHPQAHEERKMHEGGGTEPEERHVLISLHDAATGARLEDMEVRAQVGKLGLSKISRPLEPMNIAGTITYGNYFRMPKPGPYMIELEWRRKGTENWSHVVFSYALPQ